MPIAHQELGSPDAPVLVLVHGLGASGRVLERVAPLLAARFRVIVPDLPGFGETGGEHTTIEGMARAVLEVVDAEEFVAAGHSMGGLVAVALAELAPDRVTRLVLVNAPPTYESRKAARGANERILRLPLLGPLAWRTASDARVRASEAVRQASGPSSGSRRIRSLAPRAALRLSYVGGALTSTSRVTRSGASSARATATSPPIECPAAAKSSTPSS